MDLPKLLVTQSGEPVTDSRDWEQARRPEVLELFRENVYGRAPVGRPEDMSFAVHDVDPQAMDGAATRKLVDIHFSGPGGEGVIHLVLFIPNHVEKPVPGFLFICNRSRRHIDPTRETKSEFWPAEEIVRRGYVGAAFHYSDADPDEHDGFQNGVHGIFDPSGERAPDAWGAIAAWAWGASRALDYLETDSDIDASRIAVIGHSRGGKAALWAAAEDERFAMAVSNNSGCTGAALARRKQGESVRVINENFPHWFCENYKGFNDREDELPVDQHMLIALMAPRPVYVASSSEDAWADPEGEFLSCVHASPVYDLYGMPGLEAEGMPPLDSPVADGSIGYHIKTGEHSLTEYDWARYLDFADQHWGAVAP